MLDTNFEKGTGGTIMENSTSHLYAGSELDGVMFKRMDMNRDPRGTFTEVFQRSWDGPIDPVQFSVVSSEAGVMRGCHYHSAHDEYFCILTGEAYVGLRDERLDSPTRGKWSLHKLVGDDMAALLFPRGLVHGWYFSKPSMHLQAVSEAYVDYHSYDNHRVDWQDPALEIPWPVDKATMTDVALKAPPLSELQKFISDGENSL